MEMAHVPKMEVGRGAKSIEPDGEEPGWSIQSMVPSKYSVSRVDLYTGDGPAMLRRKLLIGRSDDPSERNADEIAHQVVQMTTQSDDRACVECQGQLRPSDNHPRVRLSGGPGIPEV